jgi:DNA-binding LacI/PurR family transcriptional regulator
MAISRAAALRGLALTVHVADDDSSAEEFVRRNALHHSGGILVLWDSPAFEKSHLLELPQEGVPVVDLLPGRANGISVVTADREDAGYHGTRHLIELGHPIVGFIGDTELRPQTTLRKFAGYRRALEEAGLPFDQDLVQNVVEFGFEGGQNGYAALMKRRPDVTAIFCINDAIALGAIDAAYEKGIRCPEDISVVGFGDAAEGRYWRPKLTTFALSSRRVAAQAIELIVRQRENGETEPKTFLIPEQLLVRGSTGLKKQTVVLTARPSSSVAAIGQPTVP